jgi:hypothetical protein
MVRRASPEIAMTPRSQVSLDTSAGSARDARSHAKLELSARKCYGVAHQGQEPAILLGPTHEVLSLARELRAARRRDRIAASAAAHGHDLPTVDKPGPSGRGRVAGADPRQHVRVGVDEEQADRAVEAVGECRGHVGAADLAEREGGDLAGHAPGGVAALHIASESRDTQ